MCPSFHRQKQHQYCCHQHRHTRKRKSSVEVSTRPAKGPDSVRSHESAQVGDRVDQSDAGSRGKSTQERTGKRKERSIKAVNAYCDEAKETHEQKGRTGRTQK